jgi:hypothetical protein
MPKRFQNDVPDFRAPDFLEQFQALPGWLAERLLREDESVDWVRGPWFNPSWERYVTHPALLLIPLTFGAMGVIVGKRIDEEATGAFILAAIGIFVLTIIVLGIANGYFTRLVVTNRRLVILQGYEMCRSWDIDRLPRSLLRYRRYGDDSSRSIDLDAVKTMLGGSSEKFTDARTILSFGKQLDSITKRDKNSR